MSKAQKDFVQSIYRGGHYLLTLINDILDLAKIEAGRFELFPRSFKTGLFFDDLVNMLKIRAKKKGLEFICHIHPNIPAMLHGDDKRLRQIILNLAGNAIKFTEQGEVKVSLEFVRDTLHIDISDTGAGIAAADLASIFQPFTQVGDVQHKQQGTGLGLSITQRLVKTMGGDIRVDSQVGQGSCFHVEIPLEVVNTVTEALEFETGMYHVTGYQRVSGDGALQILIVDDVAENRQIMRALLEPVGFETTEADSGEQCLDLLEHIQPDAVLMDLRMPGLDGLETTRRLRQLPGLSELPVIAITAAAFEDDRTASLAAGCDAHIAKPLRQSELFDSLARVLPITWMYEVLEQTSEDIDNLRHEALSEEQFETLSKLLKKGDISNLIKFAAELENSHCDQALSKQINTLIRQFNFKGLQRLLANLRDDSSS